MSGRSKKRAVYNTTGLGAATRGEASVMPKHVERAAHRIVAYLQQKAPVKRPVYAEKVSEGRWRIVLDHKGVWASSYEFKKPNGKWQGETGQLFIDGVEHPARDFGALLELLDERDNQLDPSGLITLVEVVENLGRAPKEVRFLVGQFGQQIEAAKNASLRVGKDALGRWVVAIDHREKADTGIRIPFTVWGNGARQEPVQFVSDGVDRSKETNGSLDSAMAAMFASSSSGPAGESAGSGPVAGASGAAGNAGSRKGTVMRN